MSDLDVSLRLRLVNQLSRPAEEAERDLKELKRAAEQLGRTRGGDQLAGNLERIGQSATDAKAKIGAVGSEADQLREKLGRVDSSGGLEGVSADAAEAKQKLGTVGAEADQLREKLGRVDSSRGLDGIKQDAEGAKKAIADIGTAAADAKTEIAQLDDGGALDKLRQEASEAEAAIKRIGSAVPNVKGQIDRVGDPWRRQPTPGTPGVDPRTGRFRQGMEGLADRSGIDAWVPIGTSAGYAGGAAAAAAVMGVGRAYKRFAGDDRETEYILMNMGVPESEGGAYRRRVRDIAKEQRAPYARTIEGLDALAATGLPVDDIMAMLPAIMRTSLASNAEPADVAATAYAIRDKMKIAPDQIGSALDAVVGGGNMGQFEVPDMARYLPTLLSYASQTGLTGIEGLRKVIAMAQAVRSDTGDSSQAATNLRNVFAKMRSEETERNFKDYGVNLPAEFKRGRAAGKDDPEILYEAAMKASKGGDPDILARLFVDQDAFLGLLSLVTRKDKIKSDIEELENVSGVVDRQWERVGSDPQSSLDALGNAADRATVAVGGLADRLGLTALLNATAEAVDGASESPAKTGGLLLGNGFLIQTLFKLMGIGPRETTPELDDLHAQRDQLSADLAAVNSMPEGGGVGFERAALQSELDAVERLIEAEMARIKAAADADPEQGPVAGQGREQVLPESMPAPLGRPRQTLPDTMPVPLAKPMDAAARQSMDGYNDALQDEGQEAMGIVQGVVDQIRSMLNFTAGPTIQPTLLPPAGGGAPSGGAPKGAGGRATASLAPGKVSVTNNIRTTNPQLAARRAQREQNRQIRMAQWNAIGDMGSAFG